MIELFVELLQISLGHKGAFSRVPSADEWRELFLMSKKQALRGITFTAIGRVPEEQKPPRQLILQWIVEAEHIRRLNEELNAKVVSISQKFLKDGFCNIILKGQGVAIYYKIDNLDLYRTPGDIDIWLDGKRIDIIKYVRDKKPDCNIVYHHVDFPITEGVAVEVHFSPSWMNSYFTNRKLQHYFQKSGRDLFSACKERKCEIPRPDLAFNRVYLLVHIYRHLFHEGVGLRQIMDYYFVLKQGLTADERYKTMLTLQTLKMARFASAIMWVLQEILGLESKYLLTSPNEKEGQFLFDEIMRAGNFGHYDPRILRNKGESDLLYGMRKVKRIFRFIFRYPSEAIWSPIFKIWHFFWRKHIYKKLDLSLK